MVLDLTIGKNLVTNTGNFSKLKSLPLDVPIRLEFINYEEKTLGRLEDIKLQFKARCIMTAMVNFHFE